MESTEKKMFNDWCNRCGHRKETASLRCVACREVTIRIQHTLSKPVSTPLHWEEAPKKNHCSFDAELERVYK